LFHVQVLQAPAGSQTRIISTSSRQLTTEHGADFGPTEGKTTAGHPYFFFALNAAQRAF
jgi:hypothetical protein